MADIKKEVPKKTKAVANSEDIEKNKGMAIVAWFIFFVPLLTEAKDSKFVMHHVNQSLNLVLFATIGYVISSILMVVLIGILLVPLVGLASFVLWILGIISAANGEMKKLPLIGNIELIK